MWTRTMKNQKRKKQVSSKKPNKSQRRRFEPSHRRICELVTAAIPYWNKTQGRPDFNSSNDESSTKVFAKHLDLLTSNGMKDKMMCHDLVGKTPLLWIKDSLQHTFGNGAVNVIRMSIILICCHSEKQKRMTRKMTFVWTMEVLMAMSEEVPFVMQEVHQEELGFIHFI